MPRMRCIDNQCYIDTLTIGNIYDVEYTRDNFCRVTADTGIQLSCFRRRFEAIEQEVSTPVTVEHYTNLNQLSVGMKVRVRSNLEHIFNEAASDPGYCTPMEELEGQEVTIRRVGSAYVTIEEDTNYYSWCVEAFEHISNSINTEEVNDVPVSNDFAVGDIVRVKETASSYKGHLAFVKEVNVGTVKLSISSYLFNIRDIEKITEEDLNVPFEPLIVVPEYIQITEAEEIKKGMRIKLPTRKTTGDSFISSPTITEALENNYDYITVKRIYNGDETINALCLSYSNNFSKGDIEILNTNFVQGTIESGHRIKDNSGRTHTYEAYDETNTNQTLIVNNDTYIDYIDSTGWFIRVWKQLVTKPRGTVEYTEYMAMTSEDYAIYKAQTELRIAYVKALIENKKIVERNELISNNISTYRNLKRAAERFLVEERERLEAKRLKEEREAKLREVNALGIWKHHDKSWI